MDKNEFFKQLHRTLADRYGLETAHIDIIRRLTIVEGMGPVEVAAFAAYRRSLPAYPRGNQKARRQRLRSRTGTRRKSRLFYERLINFIAQCRPTAWSDITHLTNFDRGGV